MYLYAILVLCLILLVIVGLVILLQKSGIAKALHMYHGNYKRSDLHKIQVLATQQLSTQHRLVLCSCAEYQYLLLLSANNSVVVDRFSPTKPHDSTDLTTT